MSDAVVREVELPADTEQVWGALTDPEQVAGWFGAEVSWDLRPGGPAHFTGDDGDERTGEVDEVVPGRRLRFRWWPEGGDDRSGASTVEYELEPIRTGTRLVITEAPLHADGVGGTTASLSAAAGATWDVVTILLWARCNAPLALLA